MSRTDNHRRVDGTDPDPGIIQEAAAVIKSGGVVAFPTRCLYGLGADAQNPQAIQRIFAVKQRPPKKPILILIHPSADVAAYSVGLRSYARDLMARFWPGQVTFIVDAHPSLPPELTAHTGSIGIRAAGHPVAAAVLAALEGALTGTSANISNAPGCARVADMDAQFVAELDLVLDAGPLEGGQGSTVVDVRGPKPVVVREGCIKKGALLNAFGADAT